MPRDEGSADLTRRSETTARQKVILSQWRDATPSHGHLEYRKMGGPI